MTFPFSILLATRLDWGFGNPNKTAALIGFLMVALWVLPSLHRRLFWPALLLCTVLGGCLMQTASRGGIVAVAVALGILLARLPRPWPRSQVMGAMASVWIILGIAAWLPTMHRFGKAMGGQDLSILQRLGLWRATPRMMLDAPGGWGLGHSADVFHQWYQPLDQSQLFASLINSHLTWLAEIGWPLRFLYVFGWITVLVLCWVQTSDVRTRAWLVIPFGVWIVFVITAWFNSVAESRWLWPIPVLSFGVLVAWRWLNRRWPRPSTWAVITLCSCGVLGSLFLLGMLSEGQPRLRLRGSWVVLGNTSDPALWVVVNPDTLGKIYGRTLRRYLQTGVDPRSRHDVSIGLVGSLDDLSPEEVRTKSLVVCGTLEEEQLARLRTLLPFCSRLVKLNRAFYPQALGAGTPLDKKIEVVAGEFSQSPLSAWREIVKTSVRTVPGAGDYLPHWPELVLAAHP